MKESTLNIISVPNKERSIKNEDQNLVQKRKDTAGTQTNINCRVRKIHANTAKQLNDAHNCNMKVKCWVPMRCPN